MRLYAAWVIGKQNFFQNVEQTFAPLQNGATKFQPGHNSIQPGQLPHLPPPIGATGWNSQHNKLPYNLGFCDVIYHWWVKAAESLNPPAVEL